jgi:hypothetical protein
MWGQIMTADIVPFRIPPRPVEDEDIDYDALFESLKGHSYQRVLVLALDGDGEFEWWGGLTASDAVFLMELAKHELIFGDG